MSEEHSPTFVGEYFDPVLSRFVTVEEAWQQTKHGAYTCVNAAEKRLYDLKELELAVRDLLSMLDVRERSVASTIHKNAYALIQQIRDREEELIEVLQADCQLQRLQMNATLEQLEISIKQLQRSTPKILDYEQDIKDRFTALWECEKSLKESRFFSVDEPFTYAVGMTPLTVDNHMNMTRERAPLFLPTTLTLPMMATERVRLAFPKEEYEKYLVYPPSDPLHGNDGDVDDDATSKLSYPTTAKGEVGGNISVLPSSRKGSALRSAGALRLAIKSSAARNVELKGGKVTNGVSATRKVALAPGKSKRDSLERSKSIPEAAAGSGALVVVEAGAAAHQGNGALVVSGENQTNACVVDPTVTAIPTSYVPSGIMDYLATSGGTKPFVNPIAAGAVQVSCNVKVVLGDVACLFNATNPDLGTLNVSELLTNGLKSVSQGALELAEERMLEECAFRTTSEEHAKILIDFGDRRRVRLSGYALRHGHREKHLALRSWVVSGSVDETEWVVLDEQNQNTLLGEYSYNTVLFQIDHERVEQNLTKLRMARNGDAFRYISIESTGCDEFRGHHVELSAMELFGVLESSISTGGGTL